MEWRGSLLNSDENIYCSFCILLESKQRICVLNRLHLNIHLYLLLFTFLSDLFISIFFFFFLRASRVNCFGKQSGTHPLALEDYTIFVDCVCCVCLRVCSLHTVDDWSGCSNCTSPQLPSVLCEQLHAIKCQTPRAATIFAHIQHHTARQWQAQYAD